MQYLVEGTRGPLPPSPEQAIALLEQTVIPHFEYVIRLKTEGKILAGGSPVGDRAFVFIIEARMTKPTASSVICPHGASSNGK
jgi:hypothetical protein